MLTQEQKETMIAALRGKSVAKENITEEYKKNLDLAEREAVKVTTSEGPVPSTSLRQRTARRTAEFISTCTAVALSVRMCSEMKSTQQKWQMPFRESL